MKSFFVWGDLLRLTYIGLHQQNLPFIIKKGRHAMWQP